MRAPRFHSCINPRALLAVLFLAVGIALPATARSQADEDAPNVSTVRSYYDLEKTKLKVEMGLSGEVPHGPIRTYFENGQLQTSATMKQGELDGELKQYDEDGHLIRAATFVDGKLEGEDKRYFTTGKIQRVTQMKNGLKHGTEIVYTRTGQPVWERTYEAGKLHGVTRAWDENGALISTDTYDHADDIFGNESTATAAPAAPATP